MIELVLKKPIIAHKETLHVLEIREPTYDEIEALGFPFSVSPDGGMKMDSQVALKYIPLLAGIIRYRIWEHSLLVRDGSGYQVDILFSLALFQETRPALSVDTSLYHSLISRWFQSVLCLMPFSQTRRFLPRRFCL